MAQAKTVYANKRNKIKTPAGDKVFYTLVNIGLAIFTLIVLIPLVNIVSCSFSSVDAVKFGYVTVYPVDFSIEGYKAVFGYHGIGRSYLNTVYYTLLGTAINLVMTMVTAYPLARKRLPFHGLITFLFMFTMYFGGGTIPNYLLVKSLGFYDTVWALVVPGALSVYNMIIARTFINNIPSELEEAATIDGCSDFRYFFSMVLPLSGTVIAVLALYYAVGHWNEYFNAFLYLSDPDKVPLQLTLRAILIKESVEITNIAGINPEDYLNRKDMSDLLKYALIVVSSAPILCTYPFVKRFFMKGVMIGAVKG